VVNKHPTRLHLNRSFARQLFMTWLGSNSVPNGDSDEGREETILARPQAIDRRRCVLGAGSVFGALALGQPSAAADEAPLQLALTPVLVTSDLHMSEELKTYLTGVMGRPRTATLDIW
jgi:hypothetical protein